MLLVEDDEVYREALARLLRHDGHEVLTARDGEEALELLANDLILSPWVIVTDLKMPGAGGAGLIHSLRQSSELKGIPVIVITGLPPASRPEIPAELLMVKPVSHLQLHERLCGMAERYGQVPPEPVRSAALPPAGKTKSDSAL